MNLNENLDKLKKSKKSYDSIWPAFLVIGGILLILVSVNQIFLIIGGTFLILAAVFFFTSQSRGKKIQKIGTGESNRDE